MSFSEEIEAQKITQEVGWGHKLCVVEPGLEGTFEVLQQSHPHWFKPFSPQATCSRACAGEQEEKLLSPPGKSWQGHSNPWPVVTSGRELLAPRDRLVSPSKDAILPSSSFILRVWIQGAFFCARSLCFMLYKRNRAFLLHVLHVFWVQTPKKKKKKKETHTHTHTHTNRMNLATQV